MTAPNNPPSQPLSEQTEVQSQHRVNKSMTALGITRQTLYNRHKELFGELKEQCRRKPRHPIDSTAYRIRDGRTIPAKEKE